jgi:hypothetical protein
MPTVWEKTGALPSGGIEMQTKNVLNRQYIGFY